MTRKATAIFTAGLLAAAPYAAVASGHTTAGLDGLWILAWIMGFAVFSVIINITSLIMGSGLPSKKARVVLYIAAVIDVIWLLYCGRIWVNRMEEHHMYQHYGPDVDAEGFANFSSKAIAIILLISIAVALNIALLVRNYRNRK